MTEPIGIRPVFEQWALEQGFDIGRKDDNSYRTESTDAAWGGFCKKSGCERRDTVDELVIERVESKREVQDILLNAMKRKGIK